MSIKLFFKQPAERQDYDINFVEWLASLSDTGATHTVDVEPGITKETSVLLAGVVKVWLSGGTSGTTYKVTATVTTSGGRVKQYEIKIKVKET